MKKLFYITVLILLFASASKGQVSIQMFEIDSNSPLDFNEPVMVGTEVALVIRSDSNDFWGGGLFIEDANRLLGELNGRDADSNTRDFENSHYENAGDFAIATRWEDSSICGFDFTTFYPVDCNSEDTNTVDGNWFVVNYEAQDIGECKIGFYDYNDSWDDPNYTITLTNVADRDLNDDDTVNFLDYAIRSIQWDANDCNDPNWCEGSDLNRDGVVDCNDLYMFADYWLWPDQPGEPYYSSVTYSIVDVNGANEITIDVNETVTLYIAMSTSDPNLTCCFDLEVNISDTNLGSIDNTEYNANNPESSTARILLESPLIQYFGLGEIQTEGIRFEACILGFIPDGNLASFEFTCGGVGDVNLALIDCANSIPCTLEGIVIHQNDPNMAQSQSSQSMMIPMDMSMSMDSSTSTDSQPYSDPITQEDIDEMVTFLEELWYEDEQLRQDISEEEYFEFIADINSYEIQNEPY